MVQYIAKVDGKMEVLEQAQDHCWVSITPPFNTKELETEAQMLDIPIDFLIDSIDIDERSRHEVEDDVKLIVINTPILNENNSEVESIYITVPIGIIITPTHVVTITAQENPIINMFLANKVKNCDPAKKKLFTLQIFDKSVIRYLTCLKKLNLKRNIIERELYNSSRNKDLRHLLSIEKSLVYFVNSLSSNELLKLKMKRTDFLKINDDEDKMDFYEDIIIDNSQALEMANVYTNILSGTMEAYASIISNNLNVFIQQLTLITILLMVPTLVASFYGMNVPVPFRESPHAFWYIVGLSFLFSIIPAWILFKKKLF